MYSVIVIYKTADETYKATQMQGLDENGVAEFVHFVKHNVEHVRFFVVLHADGTLAHGLTETYLRR